MILTIMSPLLTQMEIVCLRQIFLWRGQFQTLTTPLDTSRSAIENLCQPVPVKVYTLPTRVPILVFPPAV